MSRPFRPDLVIFDCDGVLVDSEMMSAEIILDMLAMLGCPVDLAYFAENFLGRSFPKVAAQIREDWGIALPASFETDYRARLIAEFETRLRPTPGLHEMLTLFDATGLPACVATSSSPERTRNSLRICGLDRRFGTLVFTASEVPRGKPAPDLFLHAARRMGADPARCLVIEDSMPGITAGLAAGMQVLRYTGGAHCRALAGLEGKTPPEVPVLTDWSGFTVGLAPHDAFGEANS